MLQKEVYFRFYEELNDFLPRNRRKQIIHYSFTGQPVIKDAIEAIGIPHTEIDLILINGQSVGFDARIKNGDQISVYPVFESLDISPVLRLRPKPLRVTRFICDVHLGRLVRQLRMLGFDVSYEKDIEDPQLIDRALQDRRIILTRDQGILKYKKVTHGYWIRSNQVDEQMVEVVHRFDLCRQIKPFTRCMVCNGKINKVNRKEVINLIQTKTNLYYNEFYRCNQCKKIFWKGSHFIKMQARIKKLCFSSDDLN